MPAVIMYHGDPVMVDHTPGTAVSAGAVVVTNDTPRIAHHAIAANELGALAAVGGCYRATADGAISADKAVFWDATAGKITLTAGANKRFGVSISASAADGDEIKVRHAPSAGRGNQVLTFPMQLANVANGDVLTNFTPGFAGRIVKVDFVVTVPVTTASKLATLNMEIGTTDLTGGVVSLTSAAATPLGKVIAGTAVTAANAFTATDTISIEASAVTAFSEGAGYLAVTIEPAFAG